jgi:hypothetical protein
LSRLALTRKLVSAEFAPFIVQLQPPSSRGDDKEISSRQLTPEKAVSPTGREGMHKRTGGERGIRTPGTNTTMLFIDSKVRHYHCQKSLMRVNLHNQSPRNFRCVTARDFVATMLASAGPIEAINALKIFINFGIRIRCGKIGV